MQVTREAESITDLARELKDSYECGLSEVLDDIVNSDNRDFLETAIYNAVSDIDWVALAQAFWEDRED